MYNMEGARRDKYASDVQLALHYGMSIRRLRSKLRAKAIANGDDIQAVTDIVDQIVEESRKVSP